MNSRIVTQPINLADLVAIDTEIERLLLTIANDHQLLYRSLSLSLSLAVLASIESPVADGDRGPCEIARLIAGSRAHPARSCVGVATSRSTPARAYADGGGRL